MSRDPGVPGGQIHDLSALEQVRVMRRHELSPVEIVEHYRKRADQLDARVGAYVTRTDELAHEQATEAERLLAGKADADEPGLPPLLGLPVPIKDLVMTRGIRTTLGSAAYADFVAPHDDYVVTLLREAGTVLTGKTNTPEFGLPCYTEPAVAPPARTPWDLSRSAGGSSGGAAAAVAAGLAPVAHGNDGGGSVRIPASVCGLVGLKTSRGRISNGPILGDPAGLGVNGVLARTIEDAAAVLDVLAVPMPGDPHWAPPLPPGQSFLAAARRDPGRLVIGCYRTPVVPDAVVHPDCVAAYEGARALLTGLGHEVVEVAPPFSPEVLPVFSTIWQVLATMTPVPAGREEALRPLTRWLRGLGAKVTGTQYLSAFVTAQRLARQAVAATAHLDAVLTPTLAQPPAPVGWFSGTGERAGSPGVDPEEDFARQFAFTPFTSAYNVTGQPAISLPLYWSGDGLPIGVQLVGRPAGEAGLLSLAGQLERAAPWRHRHPPLWDEPVAGDRGEGR